MANLIPAIDAYTQVKDYVNFQPLERIQVRLLQDALNFLWTYATWRWSLGVQVITLATNTQSYTITPPADLLYYIKAQEISDCNIIRDISVVPIEHAGLTSYGDYTSVSYISGSTSLLLNKNPGTFTNSKKLYLWYKKIAPVLTSGNIGTVGITKFDDDWFYVYTSIVLYFAYLWSNDQRAGVCTIQLPARQKQYSGQLGTCVSFLEMMKDKEPLLPYLPQTEEQASTK